MSHILDADGDGQGDYSPTPTQVAHPWRATVRTGLAVLLAIVLVAAAVWALAHGLDIETSTEVVVSAVVVVASAITRIMANEAVNDALDKLDLGAAPKQAG